MSTINNLSNEILMEIFSYIRIQERQRLATVCKRWGSIIESKWRTVHKLILNIGYENRRSYFGWEGGNCADIVCNNIADAVKILKKLNGNLTKLSLSYNYFVQKLSTPDELEWNELCNEIKKNEQLTSVKMDNNYLNDKNMFLKFLQCLPTQNLKHLSIPETGYKNEEEEFIECIQNLLRTPSDLKYLGVHAFAPWMMKVIEEIVTLESLHIGDYDCSKHGYYSLLNISKFPNLKELSVANYDIVDDEFLINLCNNGESLRILRLRCYEFMSQSAFDSIGKLENLSYLDLSGDSLICNIEVIGKLTNLEELYLNFSLPSRCSCEKRIHSRVAEQCKHALESLPKLKKCWFHDFKIHDILTSNKVIDQSQLQRPICLNWRFWLETFGVPQDHVPLDNYNPGPILLYSI